MVIGLQVWDENGDLIHNVLDGASHIIGEFLIETKNGSKVIDNAFGELFAYRKFNLFTTGISTPPEVLYVIGNVIHWENIQNPEWYYIVYGVCSYAGGN